jgi:hypothetical protein
VIFGVIVSIGFGRGPSDQSKKETSSGAIREIGAISVSGFSTTGVTLPTDESELAGDYGIVISNPQRILCFFDHDGDGKVGGSKKKAVK